jgi:hypothetical protein
VPVLYCTNSLSLSLSLLSLFRVVSIYLLTSVVLNGPLIFFKPLLHVLHIQDYRSEEVSALKASGFTEQQIDRFVPKKASERRKQALDDAQDLLQMKQDVLLLKEEVKGLRKFLADNKFQKGMEKIVLDDFRSSDGKTTISDEEYDKKL